MNMLKRQLIKYFTAMIVFSIFCLGADASNTTEVSTEQSNAVVAVKKAEHYVRKYGVEQAITKFKNADDIFIGDYNGMFYVSPVHPEMIGSSQFNYKDSSGVLVVQEEIMKAKTGGGWLKARLRKNPETGKFQCRKIYILPTLDNYYIGSWYYYSPNKAGTCSI